MHHMFVAPTTELFEFQLPLHFFLVLGGVVGRALAFAALKFEEIVLRHMGKHTTAPKKHKEPRDPSF